MAVRERPHRNLGAVGSAGPGFARYEMEQLMEGVEHRRLELGEELHSLRGPWGWRDWLALAVLASLTAGVCVVFVTQPQSPRDLLDRTMLSLVPEQGYGASMRTGERLLQRALRLEAAGVDSIPEALEWEAADAFRHASEVARGPRAGMAANDRLAETYLGLGWRYLERGRGGVFGFGRRDDQLEAAERLGACVVGIAPTRKRAEINAFVQELESALDRSVERGCER